MKRRSSAPIRFALRPAFAVPRGPDRALVVRLVAGYLILAVLGAGLTWGIFHRSPFVHPKPWVAMPWFVATSLSTSMGVVVAFGIVVATRYSVSRYTWARKLHSELRPLVRSLSAQQVVVVAALSSLGEELLFRGFLAPLVGVVGAALLFGLAHQVRGASRWVWIAWSTTGGLAFGAIFAATGSLVGAVLAHGLANAANLFFLRGHDPDD